jgi:hypothetical protein
MDYFAANSLYTYTANDTNIKTLLLYKVQIVNAGVYTIFYTYYSKDMLHFISAGCLITMICFLVAWIWSTLAMLGGVNC